MKHSNRQETEDKYRQELENKKLEQRLYSLRDNNYEAPEAEKRTKPRLIKLPCCLVLLLITGLSVYLIYYVYIQIKDPVYKEWLKEKQTLQQLPEKIQETGEGLKNTIDEGRQFFEKAQDTAQQTKETYDQAKDTYNEIEEEIEQVKEFLPDENTNQDEDFDKAD